jgi:hypothetical protein
MSPVVPRSQDALSLQLDALSSQKDAINALRARVLDAEHAVFEMNRHRMINGNSREQIEDIETELNVTLEARAFMRARLARLERGQG